MAPGAAPEAFVSPDAGTASDESLTPPSAASARGRQQRFMKALEDASIEADREKEHAKASSKPVRRSLGGKVPTPLRSQNSRAAPKAGGRQSKPTAGAKPTAKSLRSPVSCSSSDRRRTGKKSPVSGTTSGGKRARKKSPASAAASDAKKTGTKRVAQEQAKPRPKKQRLGAKPSLKTVEELQRGYCIPGQSIAAQLRMALKLSIVR